MYAERFQMTTIAFDSGLLMTDSLTLDGTRYILAGTIDKIVVNNRGTVAYAKNNKGRLAESSRRSEDYMFELFERRDIGKSLVTWLLANAGSISEKAATKINDWIDKEAFSSDWTVEKYSPAEVLVGDLFYPYDTGLIMSCERVCVIKYDKTSLFNKLCFTNVEKDYYHYIGNDADSYHVGRVVMPTALDAFTMRVKRNVTSALPVKTLAQSQLKKFDIERITKAIVRDVSAEKILGMLSP